MGPSGICTDRGLTLAHTGGRYTATVDALSGQLAHDGFGPLQAELLIVIVAASVVSVAFDDDGDIGLFLEPLRREINLTFTEIGQVG